MWRSGVEVPVEHDATAGIEDRGEGAEDEAIARRRGQVPRGRELEELAEHVAAGAGRG
jgi:hypothetical protein